MLFRRVLLALIFISGRSLAQDDSIERPEQEEFVSSITTSTTPDHMYHVKAGTVVPMVVVLGGASIYGMTIIYNKDKTPESKILSLNKNDVPSFDRFSAGWHDDNLDKISYYPFYAVMPLPLVLLADKRMKQDRGRIGLMYLEA